MEIDPPYQLLDFGDGRKLERFGRFLIDRPCPAAQRAPRDPNRWKGSVRFQRDDGQTGRWRPSDALPRRWTLTFGRLTVELRPTETGHLGLFPEQIQNWEWIARQIARAGPQPHVLNLFAHSGASTLAAAAAGARVVHVDAAQSAVSWARRNARHSGLEDAPVHWIIEDAVKFVRREIRRGTCYDAVILDPPSFGRGPKGQTWKLTTGLPGLLENCAKLTGDQRAFFLMTCHTTGVGPAELGAYLASSVFGNCQAGVRAETLYLVSQDGRKLPSGIVGRWP